MGQQEIINFLRHNRTEWYNSRQLSEKTKLTLSSTNTNLFRMKKHGELKLKQMPMTFKNHGVKIIKMVTFYAYKS